MANPDSEKFIKDLQERNQQFRAKIQASLDRSLRDIETSFAKIEKSSTQVDPGNVFALMGWRMKASFCITNLSPSQILQVLDNTESYYLDRGDEYPNPDELSELRAFWQGEIKK